MKSRNDQYVQVWLEWDRRVEDPEKPRLLAQVM